MSRQYDAIDLMKLKALGSLNGWNQELQKMYQDHNVNRLKQLMYQVQAGADDQAKLKQMDEKMTLFYIRLLKSIEKTMKAILREKYPNPKDDPLVANNPEWADKKWKDIKAKRDHEFELFMRKASY